MRKIIALMALAIFLVGCEAEQQPIQPSFIGGTQGLVLTFEDFGVLEEGIPSVYSTENFPVIVNVKNKGEHDLEAGDLSIRIKGISLQDFQGIIEEQKNSQRVEGISEFNRNGGEIDINFAPSKARYSLPVVGAYQPFEIYADATYNYKTKLVIPQVCFKEDLRDTSVCNVKEAKQFFVSGAPITVTSVEEDTAGQGIIALKITVTNPGGGKATILGGEFDSRYNKFSFTTPEGFECTSAGSRTEARFVEESTEIRCKLIQPLEKGASYVKPVSIELNYKYQQTILKPIRILSPR